MNIHDIDIAPPSSDEAAAHMLPSDLKKFEFGEHVAEAFSIAVGNPDETSRPLFTLDQVRAAIEADRKRMATVVESAWREGWTACRDSEYVGSEAEDSAYGDSEANRIALGLDQGDPCGLEADRKCRGEPVDIRQEVIETLEMILAADWRKWEELASPDEFVRWAKSRANYALSIINEAPQPADHSRGEPVKLCDCERGHNGMGMAGRECDCPGNNPQPAEPCDHSYHYFGDYPIRRCNKCKELEQQPAEPVKGDAEASVPSNAEILEVWYSSPSGTIEHEVIEFARALLARYGTT